MSRILFFVLCFGTHLLSAQQYQQVIGRVTDVITLAPLSGASVVLLQDTTNITVITNESGYFEFNRVAPGRYVIQTSYTGYATVQSELVVISARRSEVNIQLQEFYNTLDEVEISSNRTVTYTPVAHTITVEKALRIPANFFDPVRVITAYPGVMTANDQNNTIIMRGNSPAGLLWRINGLDVVNPNHLANAGTFSDKPAVYGGGVNIISSQLMEQTSFYAGALPARYGNALSGVVDMNLRNGDTTDYQYTAQASLIGIDLSAEGPIGRNKNTSFLVNYRYSTVGLLSNLGVKFGDEAIQFQDLTFALNSTLKHGGSLSWFGFLGTSKNEFNYKPADEVEIEKDQYNIDYTSKNFGTGLTYLKTGKLNISTGISVSGSEQRRDQHAAPFVAPMETNIIYQDKFALDKLLMSAFGRLNIKVRNNQFETGVQLNYHTDDLSTYVETFTVDRDESGVINGLLFQPYVQWRIFLSEKWNAKTALRYAYYSFNKTGSVEPRIDVEFHPTTLSTLKFSYNLVSQVQQPDVYLAYKTLELSKAHHIDLGYAYVTPQGLKLSAVMYYQYLYDIPVSEQFGWYSLLNSHENYDLADLVSQGTGRNYGVEVLVEKSFMNKSYLIAGGSLYRSQYEGTDEILRNTRFDGNYTVNLTYGREWNKTKKQSYRTFGLSSRALYLGGLRESPIIENPMTPGTSYDDERAFENKLKDYFRLDLRLSWRKNKGNYTRTIALDIQNLFNVENEAYHYYDHVKGVVTTQYQLGLMPVLVYKIEF